MRGAAKSVEWESRVGLCVLAADCGESVGRVDAIKAGLS